MPQSIGRPCIISTSHKSDGYTPQIRTENYSGFLNRCNLYLALSQKVDKRPGSILRIISKEVVSAHHGSSRRFLSHDQELSAQRVGLSGEALRHRRRQITSICLSCEYRFCGKPLNIKPEPVRYLARSGRACLMTQPIIQIALLAHKSGLDKRTICLCASASKVLSRNTSRDPWTFAA